MGKSLDKHRISVKEQKHDDEIADILDDYFMGETSDQVSTYVPLATGAITEIVSKQLKEKEDAKKKEAYEKSEEGLAVKAAKDARKAAIMAAAEAAGESDPAGPKHVAAAAAESAARVAEAKAAFYSHSTPGAAGSGGGGSPGHGGASDIFTTKNVLIGLGVLVGGGVMWKLFSGGSSGGSTKRYMTRR